MATNNAVNTTLSGQTGTGTFVGSTSPTLVTPALGVATATSMNFGGSTISDYVSRTAWTPTLTFAVPGDLSVSYATQLGIYTRIGSVVFYSWTLVCTPTFTTASSTMTIGGLPIAAGAISQNIPMMVDVSSAGITFPAGRTSPVSLVINSTTTMQLFAQGSNVSQASISATAVVSGVAITLLGSGFYFV